MHLKLHELVVLVLRVDAACTPARFSILLLLPVVLHPDVVEQLPLHRVLGGAAASECQLGAIFARSFVSPGFSAGLGALPPLGCSAGAT